MLGGTANVVRLVLRVGLAATRPLGGQRRFSLLVEKSLAGRMVRFVEQELPVKCAVRSTPTGQARLSRLVEMSHAGMEGLVALEERRARSVAGDPTGSGASLVISASSDNSRSSQNTSFHSTYSVPYLTARFLISHLFHDNPFYYSDLPISHSLLEMVPRLLSNLLFKINSNSTATLDGVQRPCHAVY